MGSDKIYRWDRRRLTEARREKTFNIDILDWTILALIFIMAFFSLRLFFIFQIASAPCIEHQLMMGQSSAYPPIFEMAFRISLALALFWACVTVLRIMQKRKSWALIAWHGAIFMAIFFLSMMNWNLTFSTYVNPPDGFMVIEPREKPTPLNINWQKFENGQWFAQGLKACIWLDENKVSYNETLGVKGASTPVMKLWLKGGYAETLLNNQSYRPLTHYERSLFLDIQKCQANIMNYGRHRSACHLDWLYPVHPDLIPPEYVREQYPMDE
jgi:hypothetical protein